MATVLPPDDALLIAEELFRSMLPQSQEEFRQELQVWHPELHPQLYLSRDSYPRCWIVTAALIFAIAHTEYARFLLESLRQVPGTVHDMDVHTAEDCGPGLLALLEDVPWRKAICRTGSRLYFLSPQTLTRAFGVGLNFAFVRPEAGRAFVDIVRSAEGGRFDQQVATATSVVRRHPVSATSSE